jgi:hypothetical protein
MAAIGRRGGEARGANRAARMQQNASGGSMSQPSSTQSAPRFGDREVGLTSGTNGAQMANGSAQGSARQSGNSLGGERAGTAPAETNVERP